MNHRLCLLTALVFSAATLYAQVPANPNDVQGPFIQLPDDAYFAGFKLKQAPESGPLLLKKGDRLAIIGDSITEQRMYTRIIETYLTVCIPELEIKARQFGWSGETAEGFLHRMTNDCLRFNPTVATLFYGMNDHRYRPYDQANAQWYRNNYAAVVESLKNAGARVILGSPGCVGKVPGWTKSDSYSINDLNYNLATFRNLDINLAQAENVRFADVYWPLFRSVYEARKLYGEDYAAAGKDGVHPGWAGHLVMAYCFLKSMGLDGDLGTISVDLADGVATAKNGHEVTGFSNGTINVHSTRYPYCAEGAPDRDDSIRSGMTLVPFNKDLNRLILIVKNGKAANYRVTWGSNSKVYPADQLAKGINLAADFAVNPFSEAFKKVDDAVARKEAYETRQIKMLFHGEEGQTDMAKTVELTEEVRQPLADAIAAAFVPVDHELKIVPE